MAILPEPTILAAFIAASLILIVTPGPDMTLFLGQTINGGRARGFASMLGATAGLMVHSMLAAFGLSALLVASVTAFTAIKIAGAVYLLWLAVQAIRHGSSLWLRPGMPARGSFSSAFAMGLAVNLLNPKIVMFFLTFLPQFVSDAIAALRQNARCRVRFILPHVRFETRRTRYRRWRPINMPLRFEIQFGN